MRELKLLLEADRRNGRVCWFEGTDRKVIEVRMQRDSTTMIEMSLTEARQRFQQLRAEKWRILRAEGFLSMIKKQGLNSQQYAQAFRRAVQMDREVADAVDRVSITGSSGLLGSNGSAGA